MLLARRMPTFVLRDRHNILHLRKILQRGGNFPGKARCRRAHHFNLTQLKDLAPAYRV
jgi:hypothetical protein